MDNFLQQLLNALSLGGTYSLLALGLAVVFSIIGLINFAHGELMTVSGYVLRFSLIYGLPSPLAILLAIAGSVLLAVAMERVAFRPVRDASGTTLLLTSFAVSAILRVLFQNFISARPLPVAMPTGLSGVITLGPLHPRVIQSISIAVTARMLLGLNLFLRHTIAGRAMRAASEDFAIVRLMGLRANAFVATAFGISGLLAGVAGLLWVAQRGSVVPRMGALRFSRRLSPRSSAAWAAFRVQSRAVSCWAASRCFFRPICLNRCCPYRDAFALILVIGVLLFRPQGLLRKKTVVEL